MYVIPPLQHFHGAAYCRNSLGIIRQPEPQFRESRKYVYWHNSSSVHNITVIGVYMVIFAIAGNLTCRYFSGDACTIISAYLEIGSGVPILYGMDISTKKKTALILSLTAFGGLSALFQSRDMIRISGLSFIKYTTGKTVCAFLCFIFHMMFL